jgi:hypothetical protein
LAPPRVVRRTDDLLPNLDHEAAAQPRGLFKRESERNIS